MSLLEPPRVMNALLAHATKALLAIVLVTTLVRILVRFAWCHLHSQRYRHQRHGVACVASTHAGGRVRRGNVHRSLRVTLGAQ